MFGQVKITKASDNGTKLWN